MNSELKVDTPAPHSSAVSSSSFGSGSHRSSHSTPASTIVSGISASTKPAVVSPTPVPRITMAMTTIIAITLATIRPM
jgi:hypothetical protein